MFDTIKLQLQELVADAKALGKAHLELLQLNLVDQAIPKMARGIYAVVLLTLLSIIFLLTVITGGIALSLIFAPVATDPFVTLQALTYGFLCLWGFFVLLAIILALSKMSIIRKIEANAYNSYLDKLDANDKE